MMRFLTPLARVARAALHYGLRAAPILVLLAVAAGAAAAQNCLGFTVAPGEHGLLGRIDNRTPDGGFGLRYAGTTTQALSGEVGFSFYEIETLPGESESMTVLDWRMAAPVLRSGPVSERPNGPCGIVEMETSTFGEFTSYSGGGGIGYAMTLPRAALFAGSVIGIVSAGDFTDVYLNAMAGGSVRIWRFTLGGTVALPLMTEGADALVGIHWGWVLGRAKPLVEPQTASAPEATEATVAEPAASEAPTAGLKPYTLEDIEAMVRNGVPTARILDLTERACVSFRINDETETRLRRIGADQELIDGLRQRCYSAA